MGGRDNHELSVVGRSLCAIAALALAVIGVRLALGFLPSRVEAQASGRMAPWLILWTLTWIAVLSGVAVAGFLVAPKKDRRPENRS